MPRYSKTKQQADNPMAALLRGFMGQEQKRQEEQRTEKDALKRLQQAEELKLQYDPKKMMLKRRTMD